LYGGEEERCGVVLFRNTRSHFGNVGSRIEKFNICRSGVLMLGVLVLFTEAARLTPGSCRSGTT
jgi:hypothetical protein